jgi:hypothetical protein
MAESGRPRSGVLHGVQPVGKNIEFVEDGSGFRGTGANGRCWRLIRAVAGWRLEFRDPGDDVPTYAGMFGTKERAMGEASRYSTRAPLSHE